MHHTHEVERKDYNDLHIALDQFENVYSLKPHLMYGMHKEDSTDDESEAEVQNITSDDLNLQLKDWNKDEQRGTNLVNFFFQLFKTQNMCDFTIKFGNKTIGIHSLILVEHSDKYYNLLCCENKLIKSVTLSKTKCGKSVEHVLDYLYTGEIDLSQESVDSIKICAKELDIQRLVNKCEEYKRRINESPNLRFPGVGRSKLKTNAKLINEYSDVLGLDIDSLCGILVDDSIMAENEVDVFNMAIAWLKFKANRHSYVKQIMSCIRFCLMSPADIASFVETQQNINNFPNIREHVYKAYKYHALSQGKHDIHLLKNFKTKPRNYFLQKKCNEPKKDLANVWNVKNMNANQRPHAGREREIQNEIQTLGCFYSSECHSVKSESIDLVGLQKDIFVFGGTDLQCSDVNIPGRQVLRLTKNVGNKKWEPISTLLPFARANHCAISIGTIVYIIGGAVPVKESEDSFAQPTSTTIAFDSVTFEWIACSCMDKARTYFTATAWKNRIFVFGGQGNANSVLKSVESFDPAFDRWSQQCPLPSARVGSCAQEFQDKIFIVGGYAWISGKPTALNDVYSYTPMTDSYCQLTNLNRGLCYASLIATRDNLWLLGGAEMGCHNTQPLISIPHVRVYDYINDKWKDVAFLNTPRHDFCTVASGETLFVIGGLTVYNRPLSSVECFDTIRSNVDNLPDLPCSSAGARACIVSPYSH